MARVDCLRSALPWKSKQKCHGAARLPAAVEKVKHLVTVYSRQFSWSWTSHTKIVLVWGWLFSNHLYQILIFWLCLGLRLKSTLETIPWGSVKMMCANFSKNMTYQFPLFDWNMMDTKCKTFTMIENLSVILFCNFLQICICRDFFWRRNTKSYQSYGLKGNSRT